MFTFIFIMIAIAMVIHGITNDNSNGAKSYSNESFEKIITDIFIAVVKLTPDLHVSNDPFLKKRMSEFAGMAFDQINVVKYLDDDLFIKMINQKVQIKVKELENKAHSSLRNLEFPDKKEILIGMWSLAYTDGQATVDQQKLISIIGKAMGLSLTACNKVETMFWQRMKAGKFGDYKEFEKRRDKWFEDEEVRKREKEFERKRKENSQSNNTKKQKVDYSTLSPELLKAYAVLGIDPSASTSEVKSQKNNLLKRYHPDLFANQGDEMIRKATIKSQSINQAYETIMKLRA